MTVTFSEIEAEAGKRSGPPPDSYLYWLRDGDHSEVFCGDCVRSVPTLPGLVVCHLLYLLGEPIGAARPHDKEHSGRCPRCGEWGADMCSSVPEEILSEAEEAWDGGWDRFEEDSLQFCSGCGVRLDVCLTAYGAKAELDHWEDQDPPESPEEWQTFCEMLNSLDDRHKPRLLALWGRWESEGKLAARGAS